ncbi:hypothetical protein R2223_003706 [Cronobacter sakazakii]|nr:hypothetical protein [Cronobacter sakazakii]ELQ6044024.1 hypothetical protein [Cronobacter sakazakii]ELQ6084569.1 hypothetical protein [Cronobacter sakazakii]ELQ6086914.1 hypothetical protein [Cronobacter sakazakii]ELQ6178830.1 hypothetical protein [Cronobacter sakazakii]
MKLIDLLVQELPKRGGWPEGVYVIEQDSEGDLFEMESEYKSDFRLRMVDDWLTEEVTREQYESALAAAQQPVWDGEGLPPVGVNAEVSVDGGRSWCSYKATSENNGMRLVEIGNFTEEFQGSNWMFRPIRSEADKRRDEAIAALKKLKPQLVGELAGYLYDEIAAGKIPHIRIEHAA